MGWMETKRRYRRTAIGPFWSSLSLAIFVASMGFLYSKLWNQAPATYLPYLCSGMMAWFLVSGFFTDGCNAYVSNSGLVTQIPFNYTTLACAVIWRNTIAFLHNFAVYLVLAALTNVPINLSTLLIIPGLLIVALNGVWIITVLGIFASRYRDLAQVVSSVMQIAMFVTPIFWAPAQLEGQRAAFFSQFNMLYHLVALLRDPMQGHAPSALAYAVGVGVAVIGWIVAIPLFIRYRQRIVFWM